MIDPNIPPEVRHAMDVSRDKMDELITECRMAAVNGQLTVTISLETACYIYGFTKSLYEAVTGDMIEDGLKR